MTDIGGSACPLPERARQSCFLVQDLCPPLPARLDAGAAARAAASIDVAEVRRLGSNLGLDPELCHVAYKFESVQQEAAFITLMHALDFGGGWRLELHAHHGRGAWQTVKPGLLSMLREQPTLPASWLASLTLDRVAKFFGLAGAVPLEGFAKQLTHVCHEVGVSIGRSGEATVGEWLMARLGHGAGALVAELIRAFPSTFDDRYMLRGREVCLYKKAQLVVGELYHRFHHEDPRFDFADGSQLTAFIDNVICAVLRRDGIVTCSAALTAAIDGHQLIPSGSDEEVSLRAAAMAGVEEIVAQVRARGEELTAVQLGNYLWGHLGKRPDYRKFTRHITQDTVFY